MCVTFFTVLFHSFLITSGVPTIQKLVESFSVSCFAESEMWLETPAHSNPVKLYSNDQSMRNQYKANGNQSFDCWLALVFIGLMVEDCRAFRCKFQILQIAVFDTIEKNGQGFIKSG